MERGQFSLACSKSRFAQKYGKMRDICAVGIGSGRVDHLDGRFGGRQGLWASVNQGGFHCNDGVASFLNKQGDLAVIDGFSKNAAKGVTKDHIDGHLALFDGTHWISDFVQRRPSPYPGNDYDLAEPSFVIYRYPQQ